MKILLCRHAESEFNAGINDKFDSNITKKGQDQATNLSMMVRDFIKENPGEYKGITSPYRRCLDTIKPITSLTDIGFDIDPYLGEPCCDYHRNQGYGLLGNYDYRFSIETLFDRIDKFISALNKSKNYIIMSHCGVVKLLVDKLAKTNVMTPSNASLTFIEDDKLIFYNKK